MQQQPYQQEQPPQPGAQDASGHQMVLCPVRVVYETQMLMQPGEHIQPNQTIFLNPQNPPPWIQNRTVQNPVVYVQHVPNYVQPTHQHIDPNQLYLQNYAYPNVQQMLVQNHQDQNRHMQMTPTNVVPNQASITHNAQTQRFVPNISQMPNTINLVNTIQNPNNSMTRQIGHSQIGHSQIVHSQIGHSQIGHSQMGHSQIGHSQIGHSQIGHSQIGHSQIGHSQIGHSQIANMNEMVSNVKQEIVTQNVYGQIPQGIPQDPRHQIQQTVSAVPNNSQRPANIYEQNIAQMQPMPQQNAPTIQTTFQNSIINVQDARKVPVSVSKNINYSVVHPNVSVKGPQTFRTILPRTNQIRPNVPQFLPVQPAPNVVRTSVPNIVNKNVPRKILPNTVQVPNNMSMPSISKTEGNNVTNNRKRKSESPDATHKKISISSKPESSIIIKKIENIPNQMSCSDIGVNTSPIHKPDGRITINNMQITPLKPAKVQNAKIKEELAKKPLTMPITEPQKVIRNKLDVNTVPTSIPSEKEKLIRNTVFTQARGRVLNDKEPVPEPDRIEVPTTSAAVALYNPIPAVSAETKKPQINKTNNNKEVSKAEPSKVNNATVNPIIVENKPTVNEESKVKLTSSIKVTDEVKVKEDKIKEDKVKEDKVKKDKVKEDKVKEDKVKEDKVKGDKVKEDKVKEAKDFILTHVLDGYVIQESNIAFPIRKPLKEKPLPNNSDGSESSEVKDKVEKDAGLKNNSKILNISNLHINDIETVKKEEKVYDKDNPFITLTPSVVKSWTAQELETHLDKYGWNDTWSVLQHHEIDGESLLLVSKIQLLKIGIKEEHADIICEFVKS